MTWQGVVLTLAMAVFLQAWAQERPLEVASFVHWYGHASFRLQDGQMQIYIDPWKVPTAAPQADVVLVTHGHFDHFAPATIAQLGKGNTCLVAPHDVIAQARKAKELAALRATPGRLIGVAPGDTVTMHGLQIVAVPASTPRGTNGLATWFGSTGARSSTTQATPTTSRRWRTCILTWRCFPSGVPTPWAPTRQPRQCRACSRARWCQCTMATSLGVPRTLRGCASWWARGSWFSAGRSRRPWPPR